jgi:hypothetical protein
MLQEKTFLYVLCIRYDFNTYKQAGSARLLHTLPVCQEPVGLFSRIPWVQMRRCIYFWRGMWVTFLQSLLPARIAVSRDFRIIIIMKRGMSFSSALHKWIQPHQRCRSHSTSELHLQKRNSLYIWRYYIWLCLRLMENTNILQLFPWMNLHKIILICTHWHFTVHVANYTGVYQLVT